MFRMPRELRQETTKRRWNDSLLSFRTRRLQPSNAQDSEALIDERDIEMKAIYPCINDDCNNKTPNRGRECSHCITKRKTRADNIPRSWWAMPVTIPYEGSQSWNLSQREAGMIRYSDGGKVSRRGTD